MVQKARIERGGAGTHLVFALEQIFAGVSEAADRAEGGVSVWTERCDSGGPPPRLCVCRRGRGSPQLEDVLPLLVAAEDLPAGAGQAQGLLAVVGGPLAQALGVLVDPELARFQDAVEVVPRPEERKRRGQRLCRDWLSVSVPTCWRTSSLNPPRCACGPAGPPAAPSGP